MRKDRPLEGQSIFHRAQDSKKIVVRDKERERERERERESRERERERDGDSNAAIEDLIRTHYQHG